jgi:hypothetical protein
MVPRVKARAEVYSSGPVRNEPKWSKDAEVLKVWQSFEFFSLGRSPSLKIESQIGSKLHIPHQSLMFFYPRFSSRRLITHLLVCVVEQTKPRGSGRTPVNYFAGVKLVVLRAPELQHALLNHLKPMKRAMHSPNN